MSTAPGGLQLGLERLGDENTWHVVVIVGGQRLCGVEAIAVGLLIDVDGAVYLPDPLLDGLRAG